MAAAVGLVGKMMVQLSATAAGGLVARYCSVFFYIAAAVPTWIQMASERMENGVSIICSL